MKILKKQFEFKKTYGFTLVELIIVITILAILATIAFVSFQGYVKTSRDSNRVSTIGSIKKGLEVLNVTAGFFPKPDEQYGTGVVNGDILMNVGYVGESISRLIKINQIPKDPLSKTNYVYGLDVSKTKYQIATISENLQSNILLATTYADVGQTAKVLGNYNGLLKVGNKIYNLPSLITTQKGTFELSDTSVNYVVDKLANLPYSISNNTTLNTLSPTEVLQKVTQTGGTLSITGVTIPSDTLTWNTQSGVLSQALGFPVDTIGENIYGNVYYTDKTNLNSGISTPSTPPPPDYNDMAQTYITGSTFSYSGMVFYVQAVTGYGYVAYTKSNSGALTSDDHIGIFASSTYGAQKYVVRALNEGATQVYNYGTSYTSTRGWNEGASTKYGTDSASYEISYNADKSVLGDFYQWGNNTPVSSLTPWNITGTNTTMWDTNTRGPCGLNYHLPTGGAGGDWLHITTIITGKTTWTLASDTQSLQKYLKLPMVGYRYYTDGGFNTQGRYGYYWSSTPAAGYSNDLYFTATSIDPIKNDHRGIGFPVRCIRN